MKLLLPLLCAALSVAARAAEPQFGSFSWADLKAAAAQKQSPLLIGKKPVSDRLEDAKVVVPEARTTPLSPAVVSSLPQLGSVPLPKLLDNLRAATTLVLDGRAYKVGAAAEPGFRWFYAALTPVSGAGGTRYFLIKSLKAFTEGGYDLALDASTVYRAHVKLNLADWSLNGQTIVIRRVSAGRAAPKPEQVIPLGDALDLFKAAGSTVMAGKRALSFYYQTDIDPATSLPGSTRTLVIVKEGALLPKGWRVPDAKLQPGAPVLADVDGTRIVLAKQTDGTLRVYGAPPK